MSSFFEKTSVTSCSFRFKLFKLMLFSAFSFFKFVFDWNSIEPQSSVSSNWASGASNLSSAILLTMSLIASHTFNTPHRTDSRTLMLSSPRYTIDSNAESRMRIACVIRSAEGSIFLGCRTCDVQHPDVACGRLLHSPAWRVAYPVLSTLCTVVLSRDPLTVTTVTTMHMSSLHSDIGCLHVHLGYTMTPLEIVKKSSGSYLHEKLMKNI